MFASLLRLTALLLVLWPNTASADRIQERGTLLYNSSKTWYPIISDVLGNIWHIDPMSINKINYQEWEVSLTSINSINQYEPNNTYTSRINCENMTAQHQGWRINGYFIENTNIIGISGANASRLNITPNTVNSAVYDFVCGKMFAGQKFYGLVPFRDDKGLFRNTDIRNNEVIINIKNRAVKKFSSSFGDNFVYCDDMRLASISHAGESTWTEKITNNSTALGIIISKICLMNQSYLQVSEGNFDFPAPPGTVSQAPIPTAPNLVDDAEAINDAKQKCKDLGFPVGNSKFGQCVLRLTR